MLLALRHPIMSIIWISHRWNVPFLDIMCGSDSFLAFICILHWEKRRRRERKKERKETLIVEATEQWHRRRNVHFLRHIDSILNVEIYMLYRTRRVFICKCLLNKFHLIEISPREIRNQDVAWGIDESIRRMIIREIPIESQASQQC